MMLMIIFVAAFTLTSCFSSPKNKLKAAVETVHMRCPQSLGELGSLKAINYVDDEVTITYELNEKYTNLDMLKTSDIEDNMKVVCSDATGDMKTLFELVCEAEAKLTFEYVGQTSGKSVSYTMDSDKLKEFMSIIAENKQLEKKELEKILQSQVDIANSQFPMQADEATSFMDVAIEDSFVVYNVFINEDEMTMKNLRDQKETMRFVLKNNFESNYETMKVFLQACKGTNRGIEYRYKGNKTQEVESITFSPEELP